MSEWLIVEKLYLNQFNLNEAFKQDNPTKLVEYYQNHNSANYVYRRLAMWAGLYSNDSAAFFYIEKELEFDQAYRDNLVKKGYSSLTSYEDETIDRINARYRRAIALLQAGKVPQADSEISTMLEEGTTYPLIDWKRLVTQYKWERDYIWTIKQETSKK